MRTPDLVARLGGDEFIVLMQDLPNIGGAAVAAERILKALAEVHTIEHRQVRISGSIGVSVFPDDGLDEETLVANATRRALRNGESEAFDGQTAEDKGRARRRGGKQHQRRDREKESGWHDQQSGVLHGLSFPINPRTADEA